MIKKRVVVAMSGGVDSSVAAALLKKDGFEVIGMTMCFGLSSISNMQTIPTSMPKLSQRISAYDASRDTSSRKPSCCGIEGIEDAKRVAGILDIAHYVLNFGKILEEKIIKNFCNEYLKGRTPNPCVRCNQFLKFDELLKKAKALDADYLATGHYAKIVYSRKAKRFLLKKGKDKKKEQSYFLYAIKKEALPFILMPLGNFTKEEVRKIAHNFKLQTADKPGSQEICFIPDDNYREFLRHRLTQIKNAPAGRQAGINANLIKPGQIVDIKGKVLGQHKGIAFYTIGQREGLDIALGFRAYIVKIEAKRNLIVLGKDEDLFTKSFIVKDLNSLSVGFPKTRLEIKTKIRYNHKEVSSVLFPVDRKSLRVELKIPQRAVTPGQSAVFYQKDVVLGGGVIEKID